MHICTYTHMYIYTHMYTYIHTCMCVCIYIYIYKYTHDIFRGFVFCVEKESMYIALCGLLPSHLIPPVYPGKGI